MLSISELVVCSGIMTLLAQFESESKYEKHYGDRGQTPQLMFTSNIRVKNEERGSVAGVRWGGLSIRELFTHNSHLMLVVQRDHRRMTRANGRLQ